MKVGSHAFLLSSTGSRANKRGVATLTERLRATPLSLLARVATSTAEVDSSSKRKRRYIWPKEKES